ncbi:MAG: sigma-54-dependent transcriptional regulator [Hyphomicrobiaceae bacterium]
MSNRRSVLLIEDDRILGPALLQRLALEGFDVRLAETAAIALRELKARAPDLLISDIRLPDASGEDIFRSMLDTVGLRPAYFMTAYGDVEQAVRLIKAGARDYMTKPVSSDALIARIRSDLDEPEPEPSAIPDQPLGVSSEMREVDRMLRRSARFDLPVLLCGETGVGKEVAARRLHALSDRSDGPFIAINCAAIPANLAESTLYGHEKGAFTGAHARQVGAAVRAAGGTLFLDEVGELPLEQQGTLLRLIQERRFLPVGAAAEQEFSGRLVAATNADLHQLISEKRFREDLYFRLAVVEIRIPPLRERPEDIGHLARKLLADAQRRLNIADRHLGDATVAALSSHDWPGNARELRNRIERALVLAESGEIGLDDLFPESALDTRRITSGTNDTLESTAKAAVRNRVLEALARANGNRTEAARLLGVSRTTIWKYSR